MKRTLRKAFVILLALTFVLSAALPALASSSWYRTASGVTKSLNVLVPNRTNPTSLRTYSLLQQDNSGKYVFRRGSKTGWASVKGLYKVTITQTKDYKGRRMNRNICTNASWKGTNYFNVRLACGTYKLSVKLAGVVYSASLSKQGWRPVRWYQYPMWRIP